MREVQGGHVRGYNGEGCKEEDVQDYHDRLMNRTIPTSLDHNCGANNEINVVGMVGAGGPQNLLVMQLTSGFYLTLQ